MALKFDASKYKGVNLAGVNRSSYYASVRLCSLPPSLPPSSHFLIPFLSFFCVCVVCASSCSRCLTQKWCRSSWHTRTLCQARCCWMCSGLSPPLPRPSSPSALASSPPMPSSGLPLSSLFSSLRLSLKYVFGLDWIVFSQRCVVRAGHRRQASGQLHDPQIHWSVSVSVSACLSVCLSSCDVI